jgi:hypothetical protein
LLACSRCPTVDDLEWVFTYFLSQIMHLTIKT